MPKAISESASIAVAVSRHERDNVLIQAGRQFKKIDAKRLAQDGGTAMSEADLDALTRGWWEAVEQIIEAKPATSGGKRVVARALQALIDDCGDADGPVERCAATLIRAVLANDVVAVS